VSFNKEKSLVILEFANNHMGDQSLFNQMVDEYCNIKNEFSDFDFAIKLQYRDLDSFIHPSYKDSSHPGVKRFESTKVTLEEWSERIDYALSKGFMLGCTPFDEISVLNIINDSRFSFLKIGSCSFDDWPMLESIKLNKSGKNKNLNIIASTGGMNLKRIDKVVSFLLKIENVNLSLMHCIAEYPSQVDHQNLSWIRVLQDRYQMEVGFSTHEKGSEQLSGGFARCLGASIFEKHVVSEEASTINGYSSKPSEIRNWLANLRIANTMYGDRSSREKRFDIENEYLDGFRRGVYASRNIEKEEEINDSILYMAFPKEQNCYAANDISKFGKIFTQKSILKDDALDYETVKFNNIREKVEQIKERVLELIRESGVHFPKHTSLEISHHYGLEEFDRYGMSMITVINLNYCKKYMFLQAGQQHPEQYHKVKEETFILIKGEIDLFLDGKLIKLEIGAPVTIYPKVVHSFMCNADAIIEEISTHHISDDSYYIDDAITSNQNRKSFISLYE